ncbi:MAG TPA: carbamoyltransferase HypF [Mycobacteriales bacterium]|nr:carbamoyltransferase HypF [Mycobacteriales bacterium]
MTTPNRPVVRRRIRVTGTVQGVGFRPYVYTLARHLGLVGSVRNDAEGVLVEAQGAPAAVDALVQELQRGGPALARVEEVRADRVPAGDDHAFVIVASDPVGPRSALIAPDTASCAACLAEVGDPHDRRYRYPFTNCTNCGPRFTIVTGVPYDRPATTMAGFALCPQCAREYHDPADRRFHAQPVCCPACGPALTLVDDTGRSIPGEPLKVTAALLRDGRVVAVKGLGGYHLAALAADEVAVATLRGRKHREDKPFAVLAPDLDAASALVEIDEAAASLLTSAARPIVLLPRRAGAAVAEAVAPGNRWLGVLLPYTPLHQLLAQDVAAPLAFTSGNRSDEPIAFQDADALQRLAPLVDAFLTHDRPIHTRTDDSVTRINRGRPILLRRSRGYVPGPIRLPRPARRPVLACGAELKNTFAIARGAHAFVSHHIGDLENYETLRSYRLGIAHLCTLLDVQPTLIACDLHPEYLSTKYALELDRVEVVRVQHHHAHIASCLADNGRTDQVIGVAFDGLGYGCDGTLWGGELLVADLHRAERRGHLETVPLSGGTSAIRQPWRMAVSWLLAAYDGAPPADLAVLARHDGEWPRVAALARHGTGVLPTSSAGRLFDAAAAIVGIRDEIHYEGQAAIEFEQRADPDVTDSYPARLVPGVDLQLCGSDLIRAVADDTRAGVPAPVVAARFHRGLASLTARAVGQLAEATGLRTVALSGGVFQNQLFGDVLLDTLSGNGFEVLTQHQVPSNDGGVSLGQLAVACAGDAD